MAGGPVHTAFVCRVGMAVGPVKEEKGRPGGPVQNIPDVGGGGGGGAERVPGGKFTKL